MNATIGRITISWTVKDSTTIDIKVSLDNTVIVDKTLTAICDSLTWSTIVNFIDSKGEIKIRRWSKDQLKYTLLTSFTYKLLSNSKSFMGEIGSWT